MAVKDASSRRPERFAKHERFFVEDVRRWTGSRFGVALPAGRTAVFGVSAGGGLALAMGLRHPDAYGAVLCAAPGAAYRPPTEMPDVIMSERAGSHGDEFWRREFPLMVAWAFGQ